MAVDVGKLDIQVRADEKQIKDAFDAGGQAAAQRQKRQLSQSAGDMARTVSNVMRRTFIGLGATVGGARGAGVASLATDAALAGVSQRRLAAIGRLTRQRATTGGVVAGARAGIGAGLATAGGAVAKAGPVGLVIGAVVIGLAAVAKVAKRAAGVFSKMVNIAETMSQRLAAVNGMLAAAVARSMVRDVQRDIRSGAVLGPQLTTFRALMDGFKDRVRNVTDAFAVRMLPVLNAVIRHLNFVLDIIGRVLRLSDLALATFAEVLVFLIDIVNTMSMGASAGPLAGIRNDIIEMRDALKRRVKQETMRDAGKANESSNRYFLEDAAALAGRRLVVDPSKPGGFALE